MGPVREIISLPLVKPTEFKAAMRRIASTVTVITSGSGPTLNGMTATAVCSVSATPPCILVVVNQDNKSHALIKREGVFAVNVLSDAQESLAQHFALKLDTPFDNVVYRRGTTGTPILDGCIANLECVVESQVPSGTHTVFIGRVVHAIEHEEPPLLHTNGGYARLRA